MPKYMLMVEDVAPLAGQPSGQLNIQVAFDPPLPELPMPGLILSPAQMFGNDINNIIQRLLTPPPTDSNIIQLNPKDVTPAREAISDKK